jgi:hypothetical protein
MAKRAWSLMWNFRSFTDYPRAEPTGCAPFLRAGRAVKEVGGLLADTLEWNHSAMTPENMHPTKVAVPTHVHRDGWNSGGPSLSRAAWE